MQSEGLERVYRLTRMEYKARTGEPVGYVPFRYRYNGLVEKSSKTLKDTAFTRRGFRLFFWF